MSDNKPIIVVAVGGNALLQRGELMSYENQKSNIAVATQALAKLSEAYRVVIVHGNGPQVGLLALQNLAYTDAPPYPLDVLGAETQGMIGYMMAQGLQQALPNGKVSTVLNKLKWMPTTQHLMNQISLLAQFTTMKPHNRKRHNMVGLSKLTVSIGDVSCHPLCRKKL